MMPSGNSNNPAIRKALQRAIDLHRSGRTPEAIDRLTQLIRRFPKSAAALGYLASVYFDQGDMKQATQHFRRALNVNPKSERASLGLFHALWEMGSLPEAVAEMQRFLSTCESPEYDKLLHDLAAEGMLVPRPLAKAV
jgi:predicted Zn-dependent protease